MDFSLLVVGAAMVTSGAALVKDVLGGKVRNAVTFLLVYLVAVGVTLAMRASDFASGLDVGGKPLSGLNVASVLLVAFALLSVARVVYQYTKATDNNQNAAETPLPITEKTGVTP